MSTIIINSVLNIIKSFSPEEMKVFSVAFYQINRPKIHTQNKKIQPTIAMPTLDNCISVLKAKYSTPKQGKLA
jgi:hypothetical protein